MPNLQQKGVAWLTSKIQANASVPAYFVRGSNFVLINQVTLGSQLLKTTDNQGNVKTERTERDFIVAANLLTFDSGATFVLPQRGDYWLLDLGKGLKRYDVMPVGNEAPWRYADPFETLVRMHTKFLAHVVVPGPPTITAEAIVVPASPILSAQSEVTMIVLNWTASPGAATYNLKRGLAPGAETPYASGLTGTTYDDVGVTLGVTYYYVVTAVNFAGESGPSNEVASGIFTTPAVPTNLAAYGTVGGGSVSWTASLGASTYDLQWSADGSTGWTNLSTAQPGTTFGDTVGHLFYRVRATNPAGSSAYTLAAAIGPPLDSLTAWQRSVAGTGSMPGTWLDQSGNGNSLTQATGANQMALVNGVINGRPVIRAADVSRLMDWPDIFPTTGSYTKVVLFKVSSFAGPNQIICGPGIDTTTTTRIQTNGVINGVLTGAFAVTDEFGSALDIPNPQTAFALAIITNFHAINPRAGDTYNQIWYQDSVFGQMNAFDVTHPTSAKVSFGGIQATPGYGAQGDFLEVMIRGGTIAPTAAQMNNLVNMVNATYGLTKPTFAKQLLFIGDSITAGGTTSQGNSFPGRIGAAAQNNYVVNNGHSGAQASDLLALDSAEVLPFTPCGVPTTVVLFAGTNDLTNGLSAAQTYASLRDIGLYALAHGASKVVAVTCLPRASIETARQALNDLMVANADGAFTSVADVRTLTMGTPGANTNLANYNADQIHPNDAGHASLKGLIYPLI